MNRRPSRQKQLYSNKTDLEGKHLHESYENLEHECSQVLNDLEEIISHSSLKSIDISDNFLIRSSFSVRVSALSPTEYSTVEKSDLNNEEKILSEIERIIQEHDEEIISNPCGGGTLMILPSAEQVLLRNVMKCWKTRLKSTTNLLNQHYFCLKRKILISWFAISKTEKERIKLLCEKRISSKSIESWRQYMTFVILPVRRIKMARSRRLLKMLFTAWIDDFKSTSDAKLRKSSIHESRVLSRKQKSEVLIQALRHRGRISSSKWSEKVDSSQDKENRVNETTKNATTSSFLTKNKIVQSAKGEGKRILVKNTKGGEEKDVLKTDAKMKLQKQQNDLENLKKAWKLAKIHRSLCLLKISMAAFKRLLDHKNCLEHKAHHFSQDMILLRCFEGIRENVKLKKMHRLEQSRQNLLMADSHFDLMLCRRVWRSWYHISSHTTKVIYPKALGLSDYFCKRGIIEMWFHATVNNRMRHHSQMTTAIKRGDLVLGRFYLRKWKMGSDQQQNYRKYQDKIKEKWDMVRIWLAKADCI